MAIPTATTPVYDPDLPVYAEPDVEYNDVGVEQKSTDSYIDPSKATVEGRTTGLLSSGNPLLEKAEVLSDQQYNKRGLLNSTMAATGAMDSVLGKAIEIATPDAALYGDMAKISQQGDIEAGLQNQKGAIDTQTQKTQAMLSAALTTQEQQGAVELQKLQDTAQMQRIEVDNQWKQMINYDTLDAQKQQSLVNVSQVFGDALTGGIERIMRDTNVENKDEAIESLMTTYETQMNTAAAIIGIEMVWT